MHVLRGTRYRCDAAGHAHSMQLHLDGTADYVRHSPAQLPKVTRWMVVDGSHAALGEVVGCGLWFVGYRFGAPFVSR